MNYFILKENILSWCSQTSILPTTNILSWWSGLKTGFCFCTDCFHSSYHMLKQKVFCDWDWKHYPVYIISQTKSTANIFIWWSYLKTWFQGDCHHSNYQMLTWNAFFVLWPGLKMFCSAYYQSQMHSKYVCLTVRLANIIPWRLLVTKIYTCCTSIIHLDENIFCFMAWLENILQVLFSGKPV